MKFTKSNFILMRWNILALSASALVSMLALFASGEYAARAERERRDAQSQLNVARSRLNMAQEDRKNMAIYTEEFAALMSRKVIGDDHDRLDWMEGLENIRRQNSSFGFRYTISPQKIYAAQPPVDGGNFDINYSEMKIQFDLLHEGQLLEFFSALRREVKGHYQLEGCALTRTPRDNDDDVAASAGQLKAECTGGWITLRNRSAPR